MICNLCPRNCNAVRTETVSGGVCGMPSAAVVAKVMLHPWEEPCLIGERGAGAVFFAGCSLRCAYCQNGAISCPDASKWNAESNSANTWKRLDASGLRGLFHDLIARGAACLDLVTPSHFAPVLRDALRGQEWGVPVVWNCGGYEKPETLRTLQGLIDIYLPDMKYGLTETAKLSAAPDYFQWASASIAEMFRQTGPYRMENGRLISGVLIRHLMLPGELENTRRVIDWVSRTFQSGDVLFSLMRQYTPQAGASGKLARRVTGGEYRAALAYLENCGVTDGYMQDAASAVSEYVPDF